MNPGTAIMMLVLASILNYGLLKFLTVNVAPIRVIKGKRGKIGNKGFTGEKGKMGDQGLDADRRLLGKNDKLLGEKGEKGERGNNASCTKELEKYCIQNNEDLQGPIGEGSHMNLTGYRARTLENICLFGYKPVHTNVGIICRSPIRGFSPHEDCPVGEDGKCITHSDKKWKSNVIDKSNESYFEPNSWTPDDEASTLMNCSYSKKAVEKMSPPQFLAWTRLLSKRDCPGVPVGGSNIIPPKEDKYGQRIWTENGNCQQQLTDKVNFGYYSTYDPNKEKNVCIKNIIPTGNKLSDGSWSKFLRCDCKPYPKRKIGESCVVTNECKDKPGFARGVKCRRNICTQKCSRNTVRGTEETDPNDDNSKYKCYKIEGVNCINNNECRSNKCSNKKCVEKCNNQESTPFEMSKNDNDFDLSDYNTRINGSAYKCISTSS